MTTSTTAGSTTSGSRLRVLAILTIATVAAVLVNAGIAATARAAGAPGDYGPLTFPAFTLFTVLGVGAGWIGWSLVRRHARDPRRALAILVPAVTVVSLVPDILLLIFRFIPGTTVSAAVALMLMHLAVVAFAVPSYALASRPR